MTESQQAFVILPFEDEFETLYSEKIKPTLEDNGYSVNKADSLVSQRAIIEDIITGITDADLIIADLTGTNPNVFYELGIAHGQGIPTVLITKDIGELPFDLSAYKTIEYSSHFNEIQEFVSELTEIAEDHSSGNIDFGSPVSDYGDVEINHSNSEPHTAESTTDSEEDSTGSDEDEEQTEKGFLEYVSDIDEKISELENTFDEISERSNSFENEILTHTNKLQELSEKEGSNSRKRANKISRDMSQTISEYSNFLVKRIEPINDDLTFLMSALRSFIEFSESNIEQNREDLIDIYKDLEIFITEISQTTKEINQFQDEMSNLKGLNRKLDSSINDLNNTLSELESILDEGVAKAERYKSLIEKSREDAI